VKVPHKYYYGQDFESLIFENLADGFTTHKYIKDPSGKYLFACSNQTMAAGLGEDQSLRGLTDNDLWDAQEAELIMNNDKKVFISNQPMWLVEHITHHDGKKMIATSFKTSLQSGTKKIIGVIGLSVIRELKHTNNFNLNNKEMDCLFYLVKGFSIKQISSQMHLSSRTIEHYLENIKIKLNCRVRSELIAKALHIPQIREKVRSLLS
jgi:DNA-binding CsgD family transcriptional regulator